MHVEMLQKPIEDQWPWPILSRATGQITFYDFTPLTIIGDHMETNFPLL